MVSLDSSLSDGNYLFSKNHFRLLGLEARGVFVQMTINRRWVICLRLEFVTSADDTYWIPDERKRMGEIVFFVAENILDNQLGQRLV